MNEVADERLMTIAELSMMLGVPIDTSTAGVIAVKAPGGFGGCALI
jgi:hypothetical protein